MKEQQYFPGSSEYFILEGEARFNLEHFGSEDPIADERINFKETVLNELVVRIADAELKINLLLQAKKHYELAKREILSAEVSLECSLLEDALQKNLLEVAELIAEFIMKLRKSIPSNYSPLFKRTKKVFLTMGEEFKEEYNRCRSFLFPLLNEQESNGSINHLHFHDVAKRLELKATPLLKYRDKVLAHKYDEDRFLTHLSLEQYCEINNAFKKILDATAIVGTFSYNDWCKTRSEIELARANKWLQTGLLASAVRIRNQQ